MKMAGPRLRIPGLEGRGAPGGQLVERLDISPARSLGVGRRCKKQVSQKGMRDRENHMGDWVYILKMVPKRI